MQNQVHDAECVALRDASPDPTIVDTRLVAPRDGGWIASQVAYTASPSHIRSTDVKHKELKLR